MNRSLAPRRTLSSVLTGVVAEIALSALLGLAGILICAAALWIAGMV